ncbi:ubiquitin carboxyl-terminal hydrolase 15-like [Saccostrea cucullata]|uniref:ubiquitin carboxyl-terminal hydrolase 15-like n=1 Tax=Saccostrea cuccullata TaxID=36930 RepID=UPI002ED68950
MFSDNIDEECEKIRDFLKTELRRGDYWYLVDAAWFKKWKKYVGFDQWDLASKGDSDEYPGPIDNSPLITDDSVLKDHLIDELDYILLPKDAWNFLQQKYGVLKSDKFILQREVIEQGMFKKHCKVEVYRLHLYLKKATDQQECINKEFSRVDTVESLELAMREEFGLSDDEEVRIWNKYMSNTYEHLSKPEQTLQEAGLYAGQVIVIETRNKNGSWPRGGSEEGFKVTAQRRQRINEEKERKNQVRYKLHRQHRSTGTRVSYM